MMTAWNRNACASLPGGDLSLRAVLCEAANEEREAVCMESICDDCLIREKRFKSRARGGILKTLLKI
jgi:hypothetical protein